MIEIMAKIVFESSNMFNQLAYVSQLNDIERHNVLKSFFKTFKIVIFKKDMF